MPIPAFFAASVGLALVYIAACPKGPRAYWPVAIAYMGLHVGVGLQSLGFWTAKAAETTLTTF